MRTSESAECHKVGLSAIKEAMVVIDLKSQRHLREHGQEEQGRRSAWELPHGSKTVLSGARPVTL